MSIARKRNWDIFTASESDIAGSRGVEITSLIVLTPQRDRRPFLCNYPNQYCFASHHIPSILLAEKYKRSEPNVNMLHHASSQLKTGGLLATSGIDIDLSKGNRSRPHSKESYPTNEENFPSRLNA